ncbi:MAG: type II secretion system F family protein [Chloroflexi bacterium]|nr:type II secretion system F family protein [Chloroflexota bacterium]MDA1240117.1 type II secretion system F family protein [Chloroflexota bacterium]
MVLLATLLLGTGIFLGVRAFAVAPVGRTRTRLDEIGADRRAVEAGAPSNTDGRLWQPPRHALASTVAVLLPDGIAARLQDEIEVAGFNFGPERLVAGAVFAMLFFGAPVAMLVRDMSSIAPAMQTVLIALAVGVGALAPVIWVQGRATRRQREIQRALPDTLDLIVVSVEAGLGFEAAIARITDQQDGPLALELRRMLGDVNLGISRREAMQEMARRARTPAVSSLVAAVLQSERTGMGVGAVLRSQAAHVRTLRRQHAEEAAMKAPLKMLFPLIFFIFPSLFVVVLGPAVLNLMRAMGGN